MKRWKYQKWFQQLNQKYLLSFNHFQLMEWYDVFKKDCGRKPKYIGITRIGYGWMCQEYPWKDSFIIVRMNQKQDCYQKSSICKRKEYSFSLPEMYYCILMSLWCFRLIWVWISTWIEIWMRSFGEDEEGSLMQSNVLWL